jgi:hypothetical protein
MAENAAARAALEELQFAAIFAMDAAAKSTTMSLVDKFNVGNSEPSLQLLGTGCLMPDILYLILRVTKRGTSVCVHLEHACLPNYFLPINYARMVSDSDVSAINCGVRLFTLLVTQKPINLLMPIQDVPYAYKLVLNELPRGLYAHVL